MFLFPRFATEVGTNERLVQENEVGPDDDDGDKDDADDALVLAPTERS